MTWQAIARKDFEDSVRSYWLWGLTMIFVALVSLVAGAVGYLLADVTSSNVLGILNGLLITTLVPLISLVIGFSAITGEYESGSLKLLMALPHSRSDVIVGKLVGRSAVMAVAIALGFFLPAIVIAATVPFQIGQYFGYVLFVILLAVMFVSIAVGISAFARTQWRAIALSLGFYFLFVTFWVLFQTVGFTAILLLAQDWPNWMPLTLQETERTLRLINPTGAFKILTQAFLNGSLYDAANRSLHISASLMVLLWIVAPPVLGLLRFEQRDL